MEGINPVTWEWLSQEGRSKNSNKNKLPLSKQKPRTNLSTSVQEDLNLVRLDAAKADDLIPLLRRCRNDHSTAYRVPIANTDVYKCSFFPQTIRDWNALPDSLISFAEGTEDGVAKFTSLVRARN